MSGLREEECFSHSRESKIGCMHISVVVSVLGGRDDP